jgi:hypothetical protein
MLLKCASALVIAALAPVTATPLCEEEGLWGTGWCLLAKTWAVGFDAVVFSMAGASGWMSADLPPAVLACGRALRQQSFSPGVASVLQTLIDKGQLLPGLVNQSLLASDFAHSIESQQTNFSGAFPEHAAILQSAGSHGIITVGAWVLGATWLSWHILCMWRTRKQRPEIMFFPDKTGKHVERICSDISQARHRVWLAMYTLTDDLLSQELKLAHQRGVDVRVIVDDEQSLIPGADATWLANSGVPVTTDKSWARMHHKFVVLDSTVLSGSFNWTKQASIANNENLCILRDPRTLSSFACEFKRLWHQFDERGGRLPNKKPKRRCQTPPPRKWL